MPKQNGGDAMRARLRPATEQTPSYADMGIEKTQASRWQSIASLPEPEFERIIASEIEWGELTTSAVLRAAKEQVRETQREANRASLDCSYSVT